MGPPRAQLKTGKWLKVRLPAYAILGAACGLVVTLRGGLTNPAAVPSPSVVLITIDTLRADHLACYGYGGVETPSLDRLSSEGVRFQNAFAQIPLTLPSHAAILTGTYPMYNGVRDFTTTGLVTGIPTLAEILHRHGYHTAAFVSSFALHSMWGLNRGFEVYDEDLGLEPGRSTDIFLTVRRGDRTVDRMLKWLGESGHRPFFVWLHLYDPHSPYRSPEPFASKYATHPYDGAIAFDDAQAGRVFARLKELKLYDQTAIVTLSDHGESLGEHGEDEHGFFIYNATLRVPLIVKMPETGDGKRDAGYRARVLSRPVGTVDIAPTVASLCGVPAAETRSFQGRSLLPLISSPPSGEEEPVYAESYYPRDSFGWHELRGLNTSHFAYIDAPKQELYDLRNDPGEIHNLAPSEASAATSWREKLTAIEQRYAGSAAGGPAQLNPETIERLRSLGYVSLQSSLARQDDPHRADPKDKIQTLRLILHASDLRRLGSFEEAESALAAIESTEPTLYVVPFERGENFLAWTKPQAALPEFGKALSLNPTFDQALLGLGRAHFMLGQDKPATESLELALRMNPGNFLARIGLAKVYWRQNLLAQAEPELARVVKEHPDFPEGHADYATVLAKLGKYREALPQFERALAMNYRDAVFYNYLGITYGQLGEPEKAQHAYEQAVAMNPRYAAAYLNLALQFTKRNQPEKARQYYQKTCEMSQALCQQYAAHFPTENRGP